MKKIIVTLVLVLGFALMGYAQQREHNLEPGDHNASKDRDRGDSGERGNGGNREPAASNRPEREPAGTKTTVAIEIAKALVGNSNPVTAAAKVLAQSTPTATEAQENAGLKAAQERVYREQQEQRAREEQERARAREIHDKRN